MTLEWKRRHTWCSTMLVVSPWLSVVAQADSNGWWSLGLTHTQDLAAQTTLMQGLMGSNRVARTGLAVGGGLGFSDIGSAGGYATTLEAAYDKGLSDQTDIVNLAISAQKLWLVSRDWLARVGGHAAIYRNDAFPTAGYNAAGVATTLGWFGDRSRGVDVHLRIDREAHDQDADQQYAVWRSRVEVSYYWPHDARSPRVALGGGWIDNRADTAAYDYRSRFFRASLNDWYLKAVQAAVALQWRQDDYRQPMMGPGFDAGSMGSRFPDGMPLMRSSAMAREDTLLYLSLNLTWPMTKSWQWILSNDSGIFRSEPMGTKRHFYDFAITSRWAF